jgi:hypothetical protein
MAVTVMTYHGFHWDNSPAGSVGMWHSQANYHYHGCDSIYQANQEERTKREAINETSVDLINYCNFLGGHFTGQQVLIFKRLDHS